MKHLQDVTYRGREISLFQDGSVFVADVRIDNEDGMLITGFHGLPTAEEALQTAHNYVDMITSEPLSVLENLAEPELVSEIINRLGNRKAYWAQGTEDAVREAALVDADTNAVLLIVYLDDEDFEVISDELEGLGAERPYDFEFEELSDRFTALQNPDDPSEGNRWEYHQVKDLNPSTVWTIVEGDSGRDWWALTGFHLVNRLFYVVTVQEWTDEDAGKNIRYH